MKAKRDSLSKQHSQGDLIKWMLASALLTVGIAANYHWHDLAWSLRFAVGIILISVLLGLVVWTKKGKLAWRFAKEARTEMRKVVWPARKETTQVAIMIVIVVVLMAIILWCVDSILMWIVSKLIG
jgi:preprotein translocase subunit SecE